MINDSLKEDGRPSQQWYWDDWFSEFGLRLCSLSARGLWIDMLGIMFKAEIRGTLTVNGRRIDSKSLAKLLGEQEQDIGTLIGELEENDVFSRLDDGTIYSRRMYRESSRKEEISRIRSEAGKKGAAARHGKPVAKGLANGLAKPMANLAASTPTPSSTPTPPPKKTREKILSDLLVSEIDKKLVQLLIDLMLENNPGSHIIANLTEKRQHDWINSCRLMREKDNRTEQQIEALIKFSQEDKFWKQNILSFPKLREKQDQLIMRYKKNSPSQSGIAKWVRKHEEKYGKEG